MVPGAIERDRETKRQGERERERERRRAVAFHCRQEVRYAVAQPRSTTDRANDTAHYADIYAMLIETEIIAPAQH